MEKLAKLAAKEDNPTSVQNRFAFLRNLHYSMHPVRNIVIAGVLGAMVSGAVGAFWTGVKANTVLPFLAVPAR
jgi:hypothetical protein